MNRVLTPRQLAICQMIADGKQNEEIAAQHCVCLQTVKHQITQAMQRTGASNRAQLAAIYVRQYEVRQ